MSLLIQLLTVLSFTLVYGAETEIKTLVIGPSSLAPAGESWREGLAMTEHYEGDLGSNARVLFRRGSNESLWVGQYGRRSFGSEGVFLYRDILDHFSGKTNLTPRTLGAPVISDARRAVLEIDANQILKSSSWPSELMMLLGTDHPMDILIQLRPLGRKLNAAEEKTMQELMSLNFTGIFERKLIWSDDAEAYRLFSSDKMISADVVKNRLKAKAEYFDRIRKGGQLQQVFQYLFEPTSKLEAPTCIVK